jgi:tetratricopeptide (TPR) repeat protein
MTTPKIIAVVLLGALVLGLFGPGALGQYYVPLRYDLRYSLNPGYITAIPYGQAPSRPDPYAFGSPMYGGYDLTGNVRAGKSFQGNVPFNQQGSQLSANVPSLALSNFRRDSIGIGDIGTGVEYGMAAPYFPGSGSVTSIGTAERRFAPAVGGNRYTTPNYNEANVGLVSVPSTAGFYAGSTPPPDVPAAQLQTMRRGGLYLPRGAIEWVNALAEGNRPAGLPQPPSAGVPTVPGEELNPALRRMDMRLGLPPLFTDVRIGLPPELGGQVPAVPGGPAELAASEKAAAEARANAAGKTETPETAAAAITQKLRKGATKETTRESPPPAAGMPPAAGTPPAVPFGLGQEGGPAVPPAPTKYAGAATFPEYMARANAQMKEGHYGAADALYEAAIVMDPDRPLALFGRINALLGDYRYLQASLVLDRALRLHPDWVREIPDIKAAYPKPDILTRITSDLATDLSKRPSNVEANLLLGYIHYASDRKEEAKPHLKKVAEVRGDKPGSEQTFLKAIEAAEKAK